MSRRDDQFGEVPGAFIEVMGRNLGGGCTVTTFQHNGAFVRGQPLSDHASASLNSEQLRGLAARLVSEAAKLDAVAVQQHPGGADVR